MGLKQYMMFTDDVFVESVNKSKWNIFSEAVTDLTFFSISFLNQNIMLNHLDPNEIYEKILDNEILNGLPKDISENINQNLKKNLKVLI